MRRVSFMYLSQEDVLSLEVSFADVVNVVEEALRSHARGDVEMPPKPGVHPKKGSFIHAMPAYFRDTGACGLKWVSGFPSNRELGLPQILGLLILNDPETGVPTCVMDCRWVTAARTAAVSAITLKHFARRDAATAGIIGAGVQGRFHLKAFKETLPCLKEVKVYDIDPKAAASLAERGNTELGIDVRVVGSAEEAVRGSDVVLTATQRLEKPIVSYEWFGPGCLGLGLEVARAWDPVILRTVDKFVTDDVEQSRYFDSLGGFPGGMPEPYAELGEVVAGLKPGRERDDERILAINIGMALEDVALGARLYAVAKERGVGVELTLMETDF